MTDPRLDDVSRIANAASNVIGDTIINLAEKAEAGALDAGGVFVATISGGITGALKVLAAIGEAGVIQDPDGKVDLLLRQAVDIWGQMSGEPSAGGTVQ